LPPSLIIEAASIMLVQRHAKHTDADDGPGIPDGRTRGPDFAAPYVYNV
jgi:hypothetical protein